MSGSCILALQDHGEKMRHCIGFSKSVVAH
jgi:hypothetical protein